MEFPKDQVLVSTSVNYLDDRTKRFLVIFFDDTKEAARGSSELEFKIILKTLRNSKKAAG